MGLNEVDAAGLFRMFKYLSHIKSFPTSLRAASVVSGIEEKDIVRILNPTASAAGYVVSEDKIYYVLDSIKSSA